MNCLKAVILVFLIVVLTQWAFGQGSGGGGGGDIEAVAATCSGASCTATANCSGGLNIIFQIEDVSQSDVTLYDESGGFFSTQQDGDFGATSSSATELTANNQAGVLIWCF